MAIHKCIYIYIYIYVAPKGLYIAIYGRIYIYIYVCINIFDLVFFVFVIYVYSSKYVSKDGSQKQQIQHKHFLF